MKVWDTEKRNGKWWFTVEWSDGAFSTISLAELAELSGLTIKVIRGRMRRHWSYSRILERPGETEMQEKRPDPIPEWPSWGMGNVPWSLVAVMPRL